VEIKFKQDPQKNRTLSEIIQHAHSLSRTPLSLTQSSTLLSINLSICVSYIYLFPANVATVYTTVGTCDFGIFCGQLRTLARSTISCNHLCPLFSPSLSHDAPSSFLLSRMTLRRRKRTKNNAKNVSNPNIHESVSERNRTFLHGKENIKKCSVCMCMRAPGINKQNKHK